MFIIVSISLKLEKPKRLVSIFEAVWWVTSAKGGGTHFGFWSPEKGEMKNYRVISKWKIF